MLPGGQVENDSSTPPQEIHSLTSRSFLREPILNISDVIMGWKKEPTGQDNVVLVPWASIKNWVRSASPAKVANLGVPPKLGLFTPSLLSSPKKIIPIIRLLVSLLCHTPSGVPHSHAMRCLSFQIASGRMNYIQGTRWAIPNPSKN